MNELDSGINRMNLYPGWEINEGYLDSFNILLNLVFGGCHEIESGARIK